MSWYSDFPARRTAQVVGDVLAIVVIAAAVWAGASVWAAIDGLAAVGEQLAEAGAGFSGTMTEIGGTLGGVPLVGDGIRAPFDGASSAGETLEGAGREQAELVRAIALWVGVSVAAAPILVVALAWLLPRSVLAVRATRVRAAVATAGGRDLLALRALTGRSPRAVLGAVPDALAGWRTQDERVIRSLARLEARSVGVRLDDERMSRHPLVDRNAAADRR